MKVLNGIAQGVSWFLTWGLNVLRPATPLPHNAALGLYTFKFERRSRLGASAFDDVADNRRKVCQI